MTEYGHSFAAWRKATRTAWHDYVCHEFVTDLGSGRLPKSAFLHYLVQDYLFLIHFSRAWALAVTKADDVAEMRACAATVNALVNDEISLHIRICAEAGIDEATLFSATEETANLAYTRYVLDAGHSGDFLDLMAALAPLCLVMVKLAQGCWLQVRKPPMQIGLKPMAVRNISKFAVMSVH